MRLMRFCRPAILLFSVLLAIWLGGFVLIFLPTLLQK